MVGDSQDSEWETGSLRKQMEEKGACESGTTEVRGEGAKPCKPPLSVPSTVHE